jgi:hypothetical protein
MSSTQPNEAEDFAVRAHDITVCRPGYIEAN